MTGFDLMVGQSVDHTLEILSEHPGATLVAGATDFIPLVRAGRWRTDLAVDISRLEELRYIRSVDGGLEIGALTTHADLVRSPLVQERASVLAEAAGQVGGPQIQARATLGGNICTASPAADTVPALLVLDAVLLLAGHDGRRRLPLAEYLTGPGQTAGHPGEILQAVHIPPAPKGAGMAFEKLGKRKALIISIVNAGALLVVEGRPPGATGTGRILEARLALGAVAPTVVRCIAAEEFLIGQEAKEATFGAAAGKAQQAIQPIGDVRASAVYRRVAAGALAQRVLARAWEACAT
jgi:xanthine dehydrogenase FAD-binding subunit